MSLCAAEVYAPRVLYGDLDLTELPFILEFGYTLGNGVTVYEELESLLRDGTLVSSLRTGNRTLDLSVLIKSTTGTQALADAGVLLDEECNRQNNTVTVYPGDYGEPGAGPALVLDTFESQSNQDPDGDLERAGYRRFLLTIQALPGVRSEALTTINWTGPGAVARSTTSTSGWTLRNAGTLSASAAGLTRTTAGNMQLRTVPTEPLRRFLYLRTNSNIGNYTPDVVIGGVAIPNAQVALLPSAGNADVVLVEVPAQFIGTTPEIDFDVEVASGAAILFGFGTTNYPNIPPGTEPGGSGIGTGVQVGANFGIDVIDVGGTARTGCTITFTAPAGGAFVYTARNPAESLRDRGLSEIVFAAFIFATEGDIIIDGGVMWFPPGTHYTQIGRTTPQPPALHPDGIWPQLGIGVTSAGETPAGTWYPYPADELAAVSFFNTTGAKTLISSGPEVRDGYQGDAVVFEDHQLHPGGTGFAVLDINGAPIATTITYYKRWKHHPAEAS